MLNLRRANAAALLVLLLQLHCCKAARIGVVVEVNIIEHSLISRVLDSLINNYWKFPTFKTTPLDHRFMRAADAIEATQKVCNVSGLNGIVIVGSCQFVSDLLSVSGSLGLPAIAVSRDLCNLDFNNNFSVSSTPRRQYFLQAAAAVLKNVTAELVAIFYDGSQDHAMLEAFQQLLSEQKIASVTFQTDISGVNLTSIMINSIKSRIRYNVIFASGDNVRLILSMAAATGTLQINYFWTVIDSGIQPSSIENLVPVNNSANILMIRESAVTLLTAECSGDFKVVFPDCQVSSHAMVELKTVEALLSLASTLQDMTDSGQLTDSNASCQPLQSWTGGSTAAALLRRKRQPSINGSWLPSGYFLETLGLISGSDGSLGEPVKFIVSGRFSIESSTLTALYTYKETPLLFPNTFMDFRGRRLRVCAPPFPPFTMYSNYSFGNASGVGIEMLMYFTLHLNFTYDVFSPKDLQFGGPQANSSFFTGCIGMLQRGEADFAMLHAKTNVRYRVIDFSEEFQFSFSSILVKRPLPSSKVWNAFTPLSWDTWLLAIVSLFTVPFVIYCFAYLSPFTAYNLDLPFAFSDEVWYKEYIWSAIGSFLQQGQDFYPFAMSPRTVMAFWWMLTIIIFGAYTGDLTAKLAVSVVHFPIQSLEDLVANPRYKVMAVAGTNHHNAIITATEGPLAKLRTQMVPVDTVITCIETLLKPETDPYTACVSDQSSNSYYARIYCDKVYVAKSFFNTHFHSLIFPKDAYYLPAFDLLLQRGKEVGLVDVIRRKYIPTTDDCGTDEAAAEAAPIPMESIGGALILTSALYACGGLLLLGELTWTLWLRRDPLSLPGY